jgi:hypothetical protein
MTIDRFDKGDVVRVTGSFTNSADAAIDPADVYVVIQNPAGTATTYHYGVDIALIKAGVGSYYYDVNASTSGMWNWRWYSTGTGQAADTGQFYVQASAI